MSDSSATLTTAFSQPFSNTVFPPPQPLRHRVEEVKQFSDLNDEDKKVIIFRAAACLQDYLAHRNSSSSRGDSRIQPPDIRTYIGQLTTDLIYACNQDAIIPFNKNRTDEGEKNFLSKDVGVKQVQDQIKQNEEAEKNRQQEEKKRLNDYIQEQKNKPKPPPKPWITNFGKLILGAFVALSIAYALLFWPDLNNYLQSPEVLNCGVGTIGTIAFGFCLLAGVLLAIAVAVKPKPKEYKSETSEAQFIAKQNQPSMAMRILSGVLFLACAAALILFTGGIDGSKMPAVNDAISGVGSLPALICSSIFIAALILPRCIRFLMATFCPRSEMSSEQQQDQLYEARNRFAYASNDGPIATQVSPTTEDANSESLSSRLGF